MIHNPRMLCFTAFSLLVLSFTVFNAKAQEAHPSNDHKGIPALESRVSVTPKLTTPEEGVIANASIQRDADTKQVRRIRGRIVVPGVHTAREASQKFLSANYRLLGLSSDQSDIRLTREVESLTGIHLSYIQVYAGLPVFGGQLAVHVTKDLAVSLVNQDLISIPRRQQIATPRDGALAVQSAVRAFGDKVVLSTQPTSEAGIIVQNGSPIVVWRVRFDTRSPGASWEVMVNASNDEVVSARNIAQY